MTTTPKILALAVLVAFSAPAVSSSSSAPRNQAAVQRAMDQLNARASIARTAPNDSFIARDVVVDKDGTEHVRFDRTHAGLPVIGGDLVVHSRNGRLKSVSYTLTSSGRPNLGAKLDGDDAVVAAGAMFGLGFRGMPKARKVIYARDVLPTLAFEVVLKGTKSDRTPTEMHYFVDAQNGRILDQWDAICTAAAAGTGNSLFVGKVPLTTDSIYGVFQMIDPTRGDSATIDYAAGQFYDWDANNIWGNHTTSDPASAASDVHYGIANVWDYYKNTFQRNGVFNDGKGVPSYVIARGTNYVNAFWNGSGMVYGDGDGVAIAPLVSLDITGHEVTHGVNQSTAGLVYSGDAGGLNEANSDILGTMTEYYANNAADPGDFLIGEKIYISNVDGTRSLRKMFKQDLDGRSFSCYGPSRFDPRRPALNDPHYTSGVANRYFYLLSQGAVVPAGFGAGTTYNLTPASLVCNGNTSIVGIGRNKAAAIWYKALTTYFTSTINYPGARAATLRAATDLYGANSMEYQAVAAAWSASNVN